MTTEVLFPGHSSFTERKARAKRRKFEEWAEQQGYEPKSEKGKGETSPSLPPKKVDHPQKLYITEDGTLVTGRELADGIVPVNVRPARPEDL